MTHKRVVMNVFYRYNRVWQRQAKLAAVGMELALVRSERSGKEYKTTRQVLPSNFGKLEEVLKPNFQAQAVAKATMKPLTHSQTANKTKSRMSYQLLWRASQTRCRYLGGFNKIRLNKLHMKTTLSRVGRWRVGSLHII